jgi:CSLREA domain-containing protein
LRLTALAAAAVLASAAGAQALAACNPRPFTPSEDNVLRGYVAYYGRPADSVGLAYWAKQLDHEGGSLSSIIQAFGVSQEFTDRYGALSAADLVTGVYRQLFGRDPEPGGLSYYVGELQSGRRTLQGIALDVLFGAQDRDAAVVANRLIAARHFVSESKAGGVDESQYDGDAMAAVLAGVLDTDESREVGCAHFSAMVDAQSGAPIRQFTVTRTSDGDDGVCDSDCSLRDAVQAANASGVPSRINLPAGVFVLSRGALLVTGDVRITGLGAKQSIIDSNQASRLFTLENAGARLAMSRLTLQNGSSDFGGALLNKGAVTLDRVVVTHNVARNGGGILNTGRLVVFASDIDGNTARSVNGITGFGGGIYNESGATALYASRVVGNSAPFNGGGIYSAGGGIVGNSVVGGNASGATGGGIDSLGNVSIFGTVFHDNSADDGGALSAREGAAVSVRTSVFEDNTATGRDLGGGGAAFNYLGTLSVTDTRFARNTALGEGGGAIETNGPLTLANLVFANNEARMHDGALPSGTAPGFGGAVLTIAGSTVRIDNATFTDNVAANSGGAIYNDRDTALTIDNSRFSGNSAQGLYTGGGSGYGGAIITEGNLTLTRSVFTDNASEEAGGAIAAKYGVVVLDGNTITGNSAQFGGGIVHYGNGASLAISGGSISGNLASRMGGGLHLTDTSVVTLTGVTVSGNTAGTNGGALYNSKGARTQVVQCTLRGNRLTSASGYGGAIHNDGTLAIGASLLADNQGGEAGGALINNIGASTTITTSTLSGNTARNGAGIAAYSGTLNVSDSTLSNNTSQQWGGALLNGSARTTLLRASLRGNRSHWGGGFSNNDTGGRVSLDGSDVSGNAAQDGSAFVNFGTVDLKGSTLVGTCNNHAAVNNQGGNSSTCHL